MREVPKVGQNESVGAIEVGRPPALVTIIWTVAVAIASEKHRVETDSFDVSELLAIGVRSLEVLPWLISLLTVVCSPWYIENP